MNPLLHARITPDAHAAKYQSLVWPRWDKDEELFTLLIEFGTAFQTDTKNQLVLYANPSKDGTRAACNARLQALLAAHTAFQSINVTVYHCALTPAIVHQLRKSMRSTLVAALKLLTQQQSQVLQLYYVEELNIYEIAQVLDLSPGRVSQVKSEAFKTLKAKLTSFSEGDE